MEESSEKNTTFDQLGLSTATLKLLAKIGYELPSPIQAALIPIALTGRDCIGQARTGTGKTAAFMLPTLEQVDSNRGVVQDRKSTRLNSSH